VVGGDFAELEHGHDERGLQDGAAWVVVVVRLWMGWFYWVDLTIPKLTAVPITAKDYAVSAVYMA
jgi:hypothetical protein